jgi:hypothetical protein
MRVNEVIWMSKIYAFLVIVPFIVILLFKGILFYEYDTKQRYIKDIAESIAYEVKITGVLTVDEYISFRERLNKLSKFDSSSIILKKGYYINGSLTNLTTYLPGDALQKGDAFQIYIKSSEVSNYSRVENGGVNPDDLQNIYYKALVECRVEKND